MGISADLSSLSSLSNSSCQLSSFLSKCLISFSEKSDGSLLRRMKSLAAPSLVPSCPVGAEELPAPGPLASPRPPLSLATPGPFPAPLPANACCIAAICCKAAICPAAPGNPISPGKPNTAGCPGRAMPGTVREPAEPAPVPPVPTAAPIICKVCACCKAAAICSAAPGGKPGIIGCLWLAPTGSLSRATQCAEHACAYSGAHGTQLARCTNP
mmetsp:Transcript_53286/g.100215  ORF Transcript_53286/g.100215 Transcript_53286/m.100215 type:complete len:213 (+) Transcript_53286:285-923(+)